MVEYFLSYADRLRPMVADTTLLLGQALERGDSVLMEGGEMVEVERREKRLLLSYCLYRDPDGMRRRCQIVWACSRNQVGGALAFL